MKLSELNRTLSKLMKDFIDSEDHIDTGALYSSVEFKCRFSNNKLDVKFYSESYIVYLEDGDFVGRFFDLSSVTDAISDFYVDNLDLDI